MLYLNCNINHINYIVYIYIKLKNNLRGEGYQKIAIREKFYINLLKDFVYKNQF